MWRYDTRTTRYKMTRATTAESDRRESDERVNDRPQTTIIICCRVAQQTPRASGQHLLKARSSKKYVQFIQRVTYRQLV